jgi:hypothetical protein
LVHFHVRNVSASSRTKHMDIHYNFVWEFVVDNFIKIIFICTNNNISDGFTKNVTWDIYEKHCKEFITEHASYMKAS